MDAKLAADQAAADAVAALIEALPSLEEIQAKSKEEQGSDYNQVQSAYTAYSALTADQQAHLAYGKDIFDPYLDYFSDQTQTTETPEETPDNACGEDAAWTLTDGVLTISGTGPMEDYASASDSPWYSSRTSIHTIVVETGITHIGDRAFYNCTALTDVQIGGDVQTIGTYAFRGCTALESITIPGNVTTLQDAAFRACNTLASITFDGNAPALGSYAFDGCADSLTILYYEGTTGWDALQQAGYTLSQQHVGQWIVDKEPDCTGDGARHLDCSYCQETITEILPGGHDYVDGVCSICQGIQIIAEGTCGANLTWKLTYGNVLTISGFGPMDNYSYGFHWGVYDESIQSVVIEDGVTTIGDFAFQSCTNLAEITIPESVTSIGARAFAGCVDLTSITIPKGVTSIGADAFGTNSRLEDVYISDPSAWCAITFENNRANPMYSAERMHILGQQKQVVLDESVSAIPYGAFRNCTDLESITIPESVSTIGEYAFEGCTALTSVTLHESVDTISARAFSGCSSLTNINIPESVSTIKAYAFDGCTSLTKITIPDSVTTIEEAAFQYCSGLETITLSDSITQIAGATFYGCSSLEKVKIPADVTTIGGNAFGGCTGLTEVEIPDSVTEIYAYAFYNCASLASVVLPKNITQINDETFYGCTGLVSVTIPEGVTVIGERAFYNCSSLESVTIPNSVTTIGQYAFESCSGLKNLFIGNGVKTIDYNAFYECSGLEDVYITDLYAWWDIDFKVQENSYEFSNPMSYYADNMHILDAQGNEITEFTLDETITTIPRGAFQSCTNLTKITIPEGVTTISAEAFNNCSGLTEITIPQNVTTIGDAAFGRCSGLTKITIPGNVTTIGDAVFGWCTGLEAVIIQNGLTAVSPLAFYECTALMKITIPESVTTIGSDAFYRCVGLTSVTLPDSLITIGSNAFSCCSGLTALTIPGSVEHIGDWAFYCCTYLANVYFDGSAPTFGTGCFYGMSATVYYYPDGTWTEEVRQTYDGDITWEVRKAVPDGLEYEIVDEEVTITGYTGSATDLEIPFVIRGYPVTGIGANAFSGCSNLTSITILGSVTDIPMQAFSDCTSLQSITIPSSVKSIGDSAFYNCSSLTSITIPDSVTTIGDSAFGYCSNLTSITIPGSVTDIPMQAFSNCTSLQGITIPSSVKSIGDSAFYNCSSLTNITIPDSVTTFGDSVFGYCSSLESITIPGNVADIPNGAFSNCSNLNDVVMARGVETIGERAFSGCTKLENITIPDSITTVDDSAFFGCNNFKRLSVSNGSTTVHSLMTHLPIGGAIEEAYLPDSITSIGDSAFSDCTALSSITIPKDVKSIGKEAFLNCTSLQSVSIEYDSCLTSIGASAFSGCSSLPGITLHNGLLRIEDNAFENCSALKELVIPSSVYTIGTDILAGCGALKELTIPFVGAVKNATYSTKYPFGYLFGSGSYTNVVAAMQTYCDADGNAITKTYFLPRGLQTVNVTGGVLYGGAFEGCSKIVTINLQDDVENVESHVFAGCSSLQTVNISGGLTSIGDGVFQNCENLLSVTISDTVKEIGCSAFEGCSSLRAVDLPDALTVIPDRAFDSCTSLETITIPATVTKISASAFEDCTKLDHVVLPNGLSSIEGYCFNGCTSLTEISIPETVVSIGLWAFSNCTSLKTIDLPLYMNELGEYAFAYCTALEEITLPDDVTEITNSVFYECSALENVTLSPYTTRIGSNAFQYCSSLSSITIPGGVTEIGECAFFDCSNLSGTVTLPSKLTKLELATFGRCEKLTGVIIPDSVISIGDRVFEQCRGLQSMMLPENLQSIGKYAFQDCSGLTKIDFPDSVQSIGYCAFAGCGGLTGILELPDGITEIADWAFTNCDKLVGVVIPANVTHIGEVSLACQNLWHIFYEGTEAQWDAVTVETISVDNWKETITVHCGTTGNEVTLSDQLDCKGKWLYECTICKDFVYDPSYTGELGLHDYVDTVHEADCYNHGWTHHYCKVCEYVLEDNFVDPLDHTGGTATCQTVGICTRCGTTYLERDENNHFGGTEVRDQSSGSCYEAGYTGDTYCLGCGAMLAFGTKLPMKDHDYWNGSCKNCQDEDPDFIPLNITTQPKSVTVANGATAKVTLKAAGDGLTYQWYFKSKDATKFSYTSSFTGSSYSVQMDTSRDGRQVYCEVTDKYGNTVQSNTVTLSLQKTAKITKQPVSVTVASGTTAKVSLTATGDGITYKWYYKNAGATKFTYTSTYTGSTYSLKMDSSRDGRQVYCEVTDKYGNTVKSNTVTLSLQKTAKITKQPVSVTVANGATAKVSITATGDGLTYKWYFKNAGASKFSLTTSFTGTTYSLKMDSSRDGRQVYCEVTDKYGNTVKSNTVTLSMQKTAKITKQPVSVTVANGATAKVSLTATGDGLTYQWYFKSKDATKFSYTSSFTGSSYSVKMDSSRAGRQVYCVVTDKYGNSVRSNTVELNMQQVAKITKQPVSVTVANGATAKVSLTATGDGLTYKWYFKSKDATKFSYTSSFTGSSYSVKMDASRNGRQVYCVVTDKYGNSVKSNTVTLSMSGAVKITTQPKSVTAGPGETALVSVKASGSGLRYEWYFKNPGASKFSLTTSFTGTTYSVKMDSSRDGRQVYCIVTDKFGNSVKSDVVTLKMHAIYLNKSGSKYHYDKECAGTSAYESTLSNAEKLGKQPCSKCVN